MTNYSKILGATALAALMASSALAEGESTAVAPADADMQAAQADPNAVQPTQVAEIAVADQAITDGHVTIDEAVLPQAGFVALHEIVGDQLSPDAIGHAAVEAGENTDVIVPVVGDIAPDTVLVAMLHLDSGEIGSFEFSTAARDVDQPVTMAGQPVAARFMVTASADAATPPDGDSAAPDVTN